jgi:enoyl-CoA hydratase
VDDDPMLFTEDRNDVVILRIEHGRVGALDVEPLNALTDAVTTSDRSWSSPPAACPSPPEWTCAGSWTAAGRTPGNSWLRCPTHIAPCLHHPRPTVAAVNGHAIAGDCVLAWPATCG